MDSLDNIEVPTIEPGLYEHYKGKKYKVIGVALHSETLEPLVVYEPQYKIKAKLWVRPYKMFIENVVIDGIERPRFRKIQG